MEFMTKEYVKQEAAKGEMASMICSEKHHHQGATCTRGELIDALESEDFSLAESKCACCAKYECCSYECPLSKDGTYGACCGGTFRTANNALIAFAKDNSPANFRAFQEAEQAVCDYIKAVIDKKKEPEVRCGDIRDGHIFIKGIDSGSDGMLLIPNGLIGNCGKKRFLQLEDKGLNVWDLIDNAKQKKVEPKKSKGEPKLRHGDYGVFKTMSGKKVYAFYSDNPRLSNTALYSKDLENEKGLWYGSPVRPERFDVLGNIFDDIANRDKKIDGFEMKQGTMQDIAVSVSNTGFVHLVDLQGTICIDNDNLEEFHTKLGHVLNHIQAKESHK